MSYTKYVMGADDTFALISKMTGVEHSSLSIVIGGPDRVTSAGFVVLDEDKIQSYGKSYSLDKASDPDDGAVIIAAIHRGDVYLITEHEQCYAYATNARNSAQNGGRVATLETLKDFGIFERD